MATDQFQLGFKRGLLASAELLKATASDLEEALARIDAKRVRNPMEMAERRILVDKIALLRGQAGHILDIEHE